jgi:hypothetical protein
LSLILSGGATLLADGSRNLTIGLVIAGWRNGVGGSVPLGICRHSGIEVGEVATGRFPDIRASIATNVRFHWIASTTMAATEIVGGHCRMTQKVKTVPGK